MHSMLIPLYKQATWEPEHNPLDQDMLEEMLDNHWITQQELECWEAQFLSPAQEEAFSRKLKLASLEVNSQTPVQ